MMEAGVTPAEGSVKTHRGFHTKSVIYPSQLRASRAEAALDRRLAFLIQHDQIAFDLLLAVLLDLVGDLARARHNVARPYARSEADLEAAHIADSNVVRHRLRQQPGSEHALREH